MVQIAARTTTSVYRSASLADALDDLAGRLTIVAEEVETASEEKVQRVKSTTGGLGPLATNSSREFQAFTKALGNRNLIEATGYRVSPEWLRHLQWTGDDCVELGWEIIDRVRKGLARGLSQDASLQLIEIAQGMWSLRSVIAWDVGFPLRDTMPIVTAIRSTIPVLRNTATRLRAMEQVRSHLVSPPESTLSVAEQLEQCAGNLTKLASWVRAMFTKKAGDFLLCGHDVDRLGRSRDASVQEHSWDAVVCIDAVIKRLGITNEHGNPPKPGIVGTWMDWERPVYPEPPTVFAQQIFALGIEIHGRHTQISRMRIDATDYTHPSKIAADTPEWALECAGRIRTLAREHSPQAPIGAAINSSEIPRDLRHANWFGSVIEEHNKTSRSKTCAELRRLVERKVLADYRADGARQGVYSIADVQSLPQFGQYRDAFQSSLDKHKVVRRRTKKTPKSARGQARPTTR